MRKIIAWQSVSGQILETEAEARVADLRYTLSDMAEHISDKCIPKIYASLDRTHRHGNDYHPDSCDILIALFAVISCPDNFRAQVLSELQELSRNL
jgi:hypothetical protein